MTTAELERELQVAYIRSGRPVRIWLHPVDFRKLMLDGMSIGSLFPARPTLHGVYATFFNEFPLDSDTLVPQGRAAFGFHGEGTPEKAVLRMERWT